MSKTLPFCEDGEVTLHDFEDEDLGFALSWKYNSVSGLRTYKGRIIISDDKSLHGWPDSLGNIPSDSELKKICDDYRTHTISTKYKNKRKAEYDQLNQFELMYDDKQNGTDNWVAEIQKIKTKYPK
jgi:hypothetical protein